MLKAELEVEAASKLSLEQRGLAVITTSGALVALLFGLVAAITSAKDFALPPPAHVFLYIALVLFVIAAILGVFTNRPASYEGVSERGLDDLLTRDWEDSPPVARKMVAGVLVKELKAARSSNDAKSHVLVGAITSEVLAMGAVAIAVGLVIGLA